MRLTTTLLLLSICFNAVSQKTNSHVFEGYYYKLKKHHVSLAYAHYPLNVDRYKNDHYYIRGNVNDFTEMLNVLVGYEKTIVFGRKKIYIYNGLGKIGGRDSHISIESKRNLADFSKGRGYGGKGDDFEEHEVRVFYWDYGIRQPLLTESFYIYPKRNLTEIEKRIKAEEERKRKRLDSISKVVVNMDDYRPGFTKRQKEEAEKKAIKLLQYEKLGLKGYRIKKVKGRFRMRMYAENYDTYTEVGLWNKGNTLFYPQRLEREMNVELPTITTKIEGRDMYLNREVKFDLEYDMVVGKAIVKNTGKKVRYISDEQLTDEQKSVIRDYLITKAKGKYDIYFQFGKINDRDATLIEEGVPLP